MLSLRGGKTVLRVSDVIYFFCCCCESQCLGYCCATICDCVDQHRHRQDLVHGPLNTRVERPITPTSQEAWQPTPLFERTPGYPPQNRDTNPTSPRRFDQLQSPLFSKLPPEVRLLIWEQALGHRVYLMAWSSTEGWNPDRFRRRARSWQDGYQSYPANSALLRSCRRIYDEAIDVLYQTSTVEISGNFGFRELRHPGQRRSKTYAEVNFVTLVTDRWSSPRQEILTPGDSLSKMLASIRNGGSVVHLRLYLLSYQSIHVRAYDAKPWMTTRNPRGMLSYFESMERELLDQVARAELWFPMSKLRLTICWKLSPGLRERIWPFELREDPQAPVLWRDLTPLRRHEHGALSFGELQAQIADGVYGQADNLTAPLFHELEVV